MNERVSRPGSSWVGGRRALLRGLTGFGGAAFASRAGLARSLPSNPPAAPPRREDSTDRAESALQMRVRSAQRDHARTNRRHPANGDEDRYRTRFATFSKGLPHNELGEVDRRSYDVFAKALASGLPDDLEAIPLGGDRRLVNPQAALAYGMEGPDSHGLSIPPAPAFSSAEEAAEIAENYWMALLRDVPFAEYASHPLAREAAADLSRFSDFRAPKQDAAVTPRTLFRGTSPGSDIGPYVSQFLWMDTVFGAERLTRQMRTVRSQVDYLTSQREWLWVQNGNTPWPDQYDPTPRYVRNARDLGQWVHFDLLFQAFLDALLVLFRIGARRTAVDPYVTSRTQLGFATFGSNHVASLVCQVTQPALKAAWFQKWYVHRRLRPEEFAGRVHMQMTRQADYPVHPEILRASVASRTFERYNSYLLPQAYPEGSPLHPAYAAGHATVAGACTTVLKAFFDEAFVIRGAVEPTPDGTAVVRYEGPDLTVGHELNKLAYNVALGRNMAGVHWRSDAEVSLRLGEEVAIRCLAEERACLHERFPGYSLTTFDGTKITI